MYRITVRLLTFCCLLGVWASGVMAEEPDWRLPWQKTLITWLKSQHAADVAVQQKDYALDKLDPNTVYRDWQLVNGYAAPLIFANSALTLPTETFLWEGGVWRDSLPAAQAGLKRYGIANGQLWLPSHPTVGCLLGWLYDCDEPWNTYHGDAHVARRAAVIAIVDLIMRTEDTYYYTSGAADCRKPPFKIHTGNLGFFLTFNASTLLTVKGALPEEVQAAWSEGLRTIARAIGHASPQGPGNMQLSAPTGIYYTYLATGDPEFQTLAETHMGMLLDKLYKPAGYITDGIAPDGSYNGIALHGLAEYWAISHSQRVLDVLKGHYQLKEYQILPEPDGVWLSPSHFNARCQDGFEPDQYNGREMIFITEVPRAGLQIRKFWPQTLTTDGIAKQMKQLLSRPSNRLPGAVGWGLGGKAPHDWGLLLNLPYVQYQEQDEQAIRRIIQENSTPAILQQERYTKNFNGEFYVIRRPGYAALFYTGPATPSDNGLTNYGNMLNREGGYINGFAGGGLSAFWTPKTGSLVLGRMTGYEGYDRKVMTFDWGSYQIGGWQDWLNNQLVGETAQGKILSSSRTPRPKSHLSEDDSRLTIEGVIPRKLPRQGDITDVNVSYTRSYVFGDDGIDCTLTLAVDTPLTMKSLYESLPIHLAKEMTYRFLDVNGNVLEEKDQRVVGVTTLELSRGDGIVRVVFTAPVTFALSTVPLKSQQRTLVYGRAFLIELPTQLVPGTAVELRYRLESHEKK